MSNGARPAKKSTLSGSGGKQTVSPAVRPGGDTPPPPPVEPKNWLVHWRILEWLGLAVGVLALAAGIVTIVEDRDIKEQVTIEKANLDQQQTKINNIVTSISTHSLPNWPEYGPDLAKVALALEDRDELVIQNDTFGYLSFTHPDDFRQFFNTLTDKVRDRQVTVRILTLNQATGRKGRKEQFDEGKESEFLKLTSTQISQYVDENRDALSKTSFGRKYHQGYVPNRSDYDSFLDALMFVEDDYCHQLMTVGKSKVNVYVTSDESLINGPFFWLRHKSPAPEIKDKNSGLEQMIFAYPRFGELHQGYAFATRDDHLMELFLTQFTKALRDSSKTRKVEGDHLFPGLFDRITRQTH